MQNVNKKCYKGCLCKANPLNHKRLTRADKTLTFIGLAALVVLLILF